MDRIALPASDTGALFVVTGASGTGKTTLVKEALASFPELEWSVSATTRPPREGETDGRDYWFVDRTEFDHRIAAGGFLEWAEVHGNRYGTLRAPVDLALGSGRSILLDIDVQGAASVRRSTAEAVLIFVVPPSQDVLEQRLRARATDSEDVIARRLANARGELERCREFDYLVVNDELSAAHVNFQAILRSELQRGSRNPSRVALFTR